MSTALLSEDSLKNLADANFLCDAIPFIQTYPALTDEIIAQIKSYTQKHIIVIFTSTQAVNAVINCCAGNRPDWQILCISGATKNAVIDFWGNDHIIASADDAIGLTKHFEQIPVQEIVFFCGNKRLDTLPITLSEQGFRVTECIVYETKLTPIKVHKYYDALLFFSPSGVESFLSENQIAADTTLFSIGKTTALALKQKVNNEVIVATQPDKNILVNTVIEFYKNHKK